MGEGWWGGGFEFETLQFGVRENPNSNLISNL